VRAANGIMVVNREAQPADHPGPGFEGGLGIFDVSNPQKPREITFWRCGGAGVHRTASPSMGATPTSRRRWTAISATSS
jgi:hypothetical protein